MWMAIQSPKITEKQKKQLRAENQNNTRSGCSTFLLLPAALLLFVWSTAANEFELYLWDTLIKE